MKNELIITSCQPDHTYFAWQLEVQFLNFIEKGIDLATYHPLVAIKNKQVSQEFQKLQERYPLVQFHWIEDTRKDRSYIPTLKPHLLSKLYDIVDLSKKGVFYIDSDVVFREVPDFTLMLNDDIIYMSDCSSYLNATYIKSKGSDLLDQMCRLVGVDKEKIETINHCSGGAQYLLKGLSKEFWERVENDCTPLYILMKDTVKYYAKEYALKNTTTEQNYHPIQAWCSEMWCTLWGFVREGCTIAIHDELKFCFATSPVKELEEVNILHNAGVIDRNKEEMFFKGQFINGLPKDLQLDYVSERYASHFYAKYVSQLVELRKNL